MHRKHLRALVNSGALEQVSRGMYRLADLGPESHAALAEVASRVPGSVVCLLSALAFHELTTQSPRDVWIAIPPKAWTPSNPPTRVHVVRMSEPWLTDGVDTVVVDNVPVRITTPVRTVVDCFRFRTSVGLDVALEALRECLAKRLATPAEIMELARRRRVGSVVRPYLEALVA